MTAFAKPSDIQNGSKVKFKSPYADIPGEIYTVSQWDNERQKGWAGDKQDRGWYFYAGQVIVKVGKNWLPVKDDE